MDTVSAQNTDMELVTVKPIIKEKPQLEQVVKVCPNPHCEEIAHNFPKGKVHCRNCGSTMMGVSKDTYQKKYVRNFFQYDYSKAEWYVFVNPYELGYKFTGKPDKYELADLKAKAQKNQITLFNS